MADNNYQEGNSIENNYAFTNPYACPTNGLKIKGIDKVDCCSYLASFSYVVAAGGATTTITPITGNESGDLNHYGVCIYDGVNRVCGSLSLAAPATPFVIDTSSLNPSAAWCLEFSGAVGQKVGDAPCGLSYLVDLGAVGVAGASGNTIPANWVNVSFLLLLTSTDDPNFNDFPVDGLEIADGETVDLTQFLDSGTKLANGSSTIFTIQMKKLTQQPSLDAAPTVPTNDVFASFVDTVSFPYAVRQNFAEVTNTVTIETAVAGTFSEAITYTMTNEGVKPSVSFTLTTDVAV